jgi:CheY-like chemotaxis protein
MPTSAKPAWTRGEETTGPVQPNDQADTDSRARSRFLANITHELRTPLHGILGYAQLLHLEGGLTSVQDARIDAMLAAGEHMLQMIDKILVLAKLESESAERPLDRVDLADVARICLDLIRPPCLAKGLACTLAIDPRLPRHVMADATALRQIILNLLGNAVKFTPSGGLELRLKSVEPGAILRIEVVDTGPGIPPAQRSRLFQAFERLSAAATKDVEGAGLGLALSARLAARMRGQLGHADNPAGGSVFWLEMPLRPADGPPTERAVPAVIAPLQISPILKVLVVDDVEMNRDIAASFLRKVGHHTTFADGGLAAVAAATADDFDVILMDLRMPGVDGLEATKRIRALPGRRGRVPIVAITAQDMAAPDPADHRTLFEITGLSGHLAKPFAPETLIAVTEQAATAGREGRQNIPGSRPPAEHQI